MRQMHQAAGSLGRAGIVRDARFGKGCTRCPISTDKTGNKGLAPPGAPPVQRRRIGNCLCDGRQGLEGTGSLKHDGTIHIRVFQHRDDCLGNLFRRHVLLQDYRTIGSRCHRQAGMAPAGVFKSCSSFGAKLGEGSTQIHQPVDGKTGKTATVRNDGKLVAAGNANVGEGFQCLEHLVKIMHPQRPVRRNTVS